MDKTINEFFERLKDEGIQSQYSPSADKIYISVSRYEEVEKIRTLLKKYRLRLSFIDSANTRLVLENQIDKNVLSLDKRSMLLTTGVMSNIADTEAYLNKEGFSLGYYFPPILTRKEMTFSDWLKKYHIPALNYYNRDLSANIRGISGILPDGSIFESINAPRMAAGPDILRFLILTGSNLFSPHKITLKINKLKKDINVLSFSSSRTKNLFNAIASLALKNIRIEFLTLYITEDRASEPILEIGYSADEGFDFKNWIIRMVKNEGATLINTISDFNMIQDRLNQFTEYDYQVEIFAKYRGINKLEELLKLISQNVHYKGYLYRYERSSFSFRLILPQESYQAMKDNLLSECRKYSEDLQMAECSKGTSEMIPLNLYSKIINSCT